MPYIMDNKIDCFKYLEIHRDFKLKESFNYLTSEANPSLIFMPVVKFNSNLYRQGHQNYG